MHRSDKAAERSTFCWAASRTLGTGWLPAPRKLAERRLVRRPVMQGCRIKIRSVRPDDRMNLRIKANLIKQIDVAERAEEFTGKNGREIDPALRPVIEPQLQRERSDYLHGPDAIDGMAHRYLR